MAHILMYVRVLTLLDALTCGGSAIAANHRRKEASYHLKWLASVVVCSIGRCVKSLNSAIKIYIYYIHTYIHTFYTPHVCCLHFLFIIILFLFFFFVASLLDLLMNLCKIMHYKNKYKKILQKYKKPKRKRCGSRFSSLSQLFSFASAFNEHFCLKLLLPKMNCLCNMCVYVALCACVRAEIG